MLGDYAGRIDCSGWCLPGTGTQTPKCQACDLRASPSSRRGSAGPHGCRQRWGNEKKPQHRLVETGHRSWRWRGRAGRMRFPGLLCTQTAQPAETRAREGGRLGQRRHILCRHILNTQIRSRDESGETASCLLSGAHRRVREAAGGRQMEAEPEGGGGGPVGPGCTPAPGSHLAAELARCLPPRDSCPKGHFLSIYSAPWTFPGPV